ncbi:flagellar biosynthetic protein FliR/FlhB [Clostridium frigidicarnis]|uniref:Flagellar biosynthetic protein FliR n=1 Tax=Clostridium frigidicarnis TaxID=84698 RepID=A0A1I0VEY1_9CLOT|nr:fused FliR family export protein/FlhB family type III secretion system protein [Clostridium frigidicarnis]SFA74914.1 flagellar biosynthetic protein FliR/FlhB [Clostridium frigidicarnis]
MALYLLAIFFISIRLGVFFLTVPAFFPTGTPKPLKVGFSLILAYMVVPTIDYSILNDLANWYNVIIIVINETMAGLFLAVSTIFAFEIIQMAGAFMDFQIGLSMLSAYDPNTKKSSTLLERIMFWVGIMIFFIIDGHHILIRALIESFNVVKLGNSIVFQDTIMAVIENFIKYFSIGLKIAIPIVLIIIIADLVLGLVSRTVPQLNVMILGLPVKILVGLTAFTFALPMIINAIQYVIESFPDLIKNIYKVLPLIIIFSNDKTEEATPKKLSDARKKGQVPRSKEISVAFTLGAITLILMSLNSYIIQESLTSLQFSLSNILNDEINYLNLQKILLKFIVDFAKVYLPIAIPIMVVGVFSSVAQTGLMLTTEPLKPSFSKINPINGFKKMFSVKSVMDLAKNLVVITIVGYIGYSFILSNYINIMDTINININSVLPKAMDLVVSIFFKVTLVLVVIAIIDFVFQIRQFKKEMRMSKQEIKEEFKQAEGDPQVKSKIRQKQREMVTKRMMQAVPEATVIITNPTHLAIALKYEEGGNEAPKVIAKGADHVALRIKEKAKEHEIPIIENKPLARLIYEKVDLDREVPEDMYVAVAEVLAVVYKMKKKKS